MTEYTNNFDETKYMSYLIKYNELLQKYKKIMNYYKNTWKFGKKLRIAP